MMLMQSSVRCLRGGVGRRLQAPPARPARCSSKIPNRPLCAGNDDRGTAAARLRHPLSTPRHPRRWLSAASSSSSGPGYQTTSERRRRAILSSALERVHEQGWTADAVAAGTLDAGYPPVFGRVSPSTSPFGSAELVSFFMGECNSRLREELAGERRGDRIKRGGGGGNAAMEGASSRIAKALRMRLSMVLPYVASGRWNEGMAIGALPQNAYRTSQQLDDMATIVLDYALEKDDANTNPAHNPAQRVAVVAAYAAAELHLLSDGRDAVADVGRHVTWAFVEARSADVARLVADGGSMPSFHGISMPDPTHVAAASAVASSIVGAALSLAAPSAAAAAGHILPRAMASATYMLTHLQDAFGSQFMGTKQRDGTRPSDYAAEAEGLPPFDASEEIFPERTASNA